MKTAMQGILIASEDHVVVDMLPLKWVAIACRMASSREPDCHTCERPCQSCFGLMIAANVRSAKGRLVGWVAKIFRIQATLQRPVDAGVEPYVPDLMSCRVSRLVRA